MNARCVRSAAAHNKFSTYGDLDRSNRRLDARALTVVGPGCGDSKSEVVECGAGKESRDRVEPDGYCVARVNGLRDAAAAAAQYTNIVGIYDDSPHGSRQSGVA